MASTTTLRDGKSSLLCVGGAGKLAEVCINRWISEGKFENIYSLDIRKSTNMECIDILLDINSEEDYDKLSNWINRERVENVIIFAGYDFPQGKDAEIFGSPFATNKNQLDKCWEINCTIPLLIAKAYDENDVAINMCLIGSIYGNVLPKRDLYSDNGKSFKPCAYGMSKKALEILNRQCAVYFGEKGGCCNLVRFGGVDCGVNKEFKLRYEARSINKRMVSLDSVFAILTQLASRVVGDMNGAVIDVDSGFSKY